MVLRGLGWTMNGIDAFDRITTEPARSRTWSQTRTNSRRPPAR